LPAEFVQIVARGFDPCGHFVTILTVEPDDIDADGMESAQHFGKIWLALGGDLHGHRDGITVRLISTSSPLVGW